MTVFVAQAADGNPWQSHVYAALQGVLDRKLDLRPDVSATGQRHTAEAWQHLARMQAANLPHCTTLIC